MRRIFLLLALGLGMGFKLPAQDEASQPLKRKWYDNVVRLLKGGDGHYYLVRNRGDQYWSFGRAGLHRFEVWRFGPDLKAKEIISVGSKSGENMISNAYEVLPAPDGVAFLSVARSGSEGLHELRLCQPRYGASSADFSCRALATLHEFSPRISQPDLRVAFSPDSSLVLITWRMISGRDENDNSTSCLVMDRDLNILAGPFSPFLGARHGCRILRTGITDQARIMFWVKADRGDGIFASSRSASFHLLDCDLELGEMREIRLGHSGLAMMDARLQFAGDGSIRVAGWWINGQDPGREAGVYIGTIGEGDTLEGLGLREFDAEMRREMLPRLQADGDVWFRPSYNNQLLEVDSGLLYVMHLLGDLEPGLNADMPGSKIDNVLVSYEIDGKGKMERVKLGGFCNDARSDYKETYSWVPVATQAGWSALAVDFSQIPAFSKSWQGKPVLIPISPGSEDISELNIRSQTGEYLIPAPRICLKEGPGTFLFLAKSRKHYQLRRLQF